MTSLVLDLLSSVLLIGGAAFVLIGSIGLARLPDIFSRLHGPTKATTLGVGALLLSSVLHFAALGVVSVHELLVAAFLLLTAPVSGHLIARAALHRSGKRPDDSNTE